MARRIVGFVAAGLLGAGFAWGEAARDIKADYRPPSAIPYPSDNPFTAAKAGLGRDLFFDPVLSRSSTISCSSCHLPALSWGDGRARAVGEGHTPLPLRAPTLINVAWLDRLGWDGKFPTLESVAYAPLLGAANMGMTEPEVISRLSARPDYVAKFDTAFGTPDITRPRIEAALATYQRSIVSTPGPFDRWIAGDDQAIGVSAKRGFGLFNGKAHCAACHTGWAFSDGSFHDIGTAHGDDIGRGRLFPTSVKLRYAFKTPTLRDVAQRAPYMHNGSIATLRDVVDLYDRGGVARPSRSEEIRPLALSEQDKQDLIAFLGTLTGDPPPPDHPAKAAEATSLRP